MSAALKLAHVLLIVGVYFWFLHQVLEWKLLAWCYLSPFLLLPLTLLLLRIVGGTSPQEIKESHELRTLQQPAEGRGGG
jgi:hypothetical protein